MGWIADIRASRAPLLAFVAIGVVWAGFAAQVPVVKAQIGASDAQFGMVFLIASVGALGAMWLAPLVDRVFGAASLQVGVGFTAVSYLIPGQAHGIVLFTVGLFLISAGSGVTDVLMNARISEIESATRRSLMNLNHAVFSFGYAGAAILTGLAREAAYPPAVIFPVIGVFVLSLTLFMRVSHKTLTEEKAVGTQPVARGIVWIGGLVVMAGFFTEQATEGWSALHVERTLGGGAAQGAMGPAILGLTMGFGRLFGHAIAKHIAETVMIAAACLIASAGLVIAATAPTLFLAYLGFGLVGLGISVVAPLALAFVGRYVPASQRVQALSRASVIGYGAFFVGPSVMGLTSEFFGLDVAFLVVAAGLVVVAVVLVPLLARRVAQAGLV
jgi:MFS family permease